MNQEIVDVLLIAMWFLVPYMIGMGLVIRWEKSNTTTPQAIGHFMTGIGIGSVIALFITFVLDSFIGIL
jgi:hypothetical protein